MARRDYWNPFEEAARLLREVERFLKGFAVTAPSYFREAIREIEEYATPSLDILETPDAIIVRAEIPGVRKDDIKVRATPTSLEIVAERKEEIGETGENYVLRERKWTGYRRFITLPTEVDPSGAKAKYENGVLEVRLPKVRKEPKFEIKIE